MTENEKICPIMSQPVAVPHQSGIVMHYELCLKERCTAWQPPCLNFEANGRCLIVHDCDDSGFMCHGGCRLIP